MSTIPINESVPSSLFSETLYLARETMFVDVKRSPRGYVYLQITASEVQEVDGERQFKREKIFVPASVAERFMDVLKRANEVVAREKSIPKPSQDSATL